MSRFIELGLAAAITTGVALVSAGTRSVSEVEATDSCSPHSLFLPAINQSAHPAESTPTSGRNRNYRNIRNCNRLNPIQTADVRTQQPYPTVRRGDIGAPTIVVGNPAPTNTPTP